MARISSLRLSLCCAIAIVAAALPLLAADHTILNTADYARYVNKFNTMEDETFVNVIPNSEAWQWMAANIPLFDCPAEQLQETYYFRWWTFRKHIVATPFGRVMTEFLRAVSHGGQYNTIACAYGHHLTEGRWLADQSHLDEYTHFWFRSGPGGTPPQHFHNFSSWAAAALYNRYLVTGDRKFIVDLLPDLIADYGVWESQRQNPDGLFWQFDVRDGMEESISGSRRDKNVRPTINSYMVANAKAISQIAILAGKDDLAKQWLEKSETLKKKMIAAMWDGDAKFFKVQFADGKLSDAREAIGFVPWMFNIPGPEATVAWKQLTDRNGFWAPQGITTAERRHPKFRSHGSGSCEWDGAVWPFATSQTMNGLANVLRGPEQSVVTKRDYFNALLTYAHSQQMDGKPYIGEYLDEVDGHWLITGPKAARSRYYDHSTFCDLVIGGLCGLMPRDDDIVEVDPLLPDDAWNWFCLDGVPYRGHSLTIEWDKNGTRYNRGVGLSIWCDGQRIAQSPVIARMTAKIPDKVAQ